MRLQQKWIPVLRENAARIRSAFITVLVALHFHLHRNERLSCPATMTKTTILGVIGRAVAARVAPAAKAAPVRRGGQKRNSPSAALPARTMAVSASLTQGSARTVVRRAANSAIGRPVSTGMTVRKATAGIARATLGRAVNFARA